MSDDESAGTPDGMTVYSSPGILPKSTLVTPGVALFDLGTRTFLRDATTGLMKRIHWVDQAVALALGVTNGKLTSNPTLGNKLRLIQRNDPIRLQAEVNDAVRVALFPFIDRRDIVVTDVQVSQPIRSQLLVAVYYINLRLSPSTKLPDNISFLF